MNRVQLIHTNQASATYRVLGLGIEDKIYKDNNDKQWLTCINLLAYGVLSTVPCVLKVPPHSFLMAALCGMLMMILQSPTGVLRYREVK